MISFRRLYLDKFLEKTSFNGRVLDIGGKKENKRGDFRPPLNKVESWKYLNIDESTNPDYLSSVESIPLKNNEIDCILMSEVIEHLEKPEECLKECYRVLDVSGKFVATIPFMYAIHGDPDDYQRWTPSKIEKVLSEVGFREIKIEPMGSLFAVVYDLLRYSLIVASKNKRAIKNRLIIRFILPTFSRICLHLDQKYSYKNKFITTGYFIEGVKK